LDWQRFVVATNPGGAVIGCAQVKPHRDGSYELASLVVDPDHRGQGIARLVIEHLIQLHEGDLYLMCRSSLGEFYGRFGFDAIPEPEMPPFFQRIAKLASLARISRKEGETLLVMKHSHFVS
jgi:N-acetylglutamate synthase-like GNAT family acetyltransferase